MYLHWGRLVRVCGLVLRPLLYAGAKSDCGREGVWKEVKSYKYALLGITVLQAESKAVEVGIRCAVRLDGYDEESPQLSFRYSENCHERTR